MNSKYSNFFNPQALFSLMVLVFVLPIFVFAQSDDTSSLLDEIVATSTATTTLINFQIEQSQEVKSQKNEVESFDSDVVNNKNSKINSNDYVLDLVSEIEVFSLSESPEMEFKFKKRQNLMKNIWGALKSVFVDDYKDINIKSL